MISRIFYVSNTCAEKTYKEISSASNRLLAQQAQKFNKLIMEGLVCNNTEVICLSGRPVNRLVSKKAFYNYMREQDCGVQYVYMPFLNFPVIRQIMIFIGAFLYILHNAKKNDCVICDVLNFSNSCSALIASRIIRIPAVAIITDVPGYMSYQKSNHNMRLIDKIQLEVINTYSGYVLLTEKMNDVVNLHNAPYIVIEGVSDPAENEHSNRIEAKFKPRVVMYAGILDQKYGVTLLVDAFKHNELSDYNLHIYGSGDAEQYILEAAKLYSNIFFFGVVPNDRIVAAERRATLLVNPRPTSEIFTHYSFPSKNMEYMTSGTPILTTKLLGMPKEYLEYVYILEDESEIGIVNRISELMELSKGQIHERGLNGKDFVIQFKSNTKQAERILNMFEVIKSQRTKLQKNSENY